MSSKGYKELGYEYIVIDDCWSEKKREESGVLQADHIRFPNGMKHVSDYVSKKKKKENS